MASRRVRRLGAVAIVLGAAALAHAVGNGDIRPVQPVTVVTVTTLTGTGTGTATLQNTTTSTTYNVLIGSDATCDPELSFSVPGGNPIVGFAPQTTHDIQLVCPARSGPAMRRCLYHATNSVNATPLTDFFGLCLYGGSPGTLIPQQTSLDFGTVAVGQESMLTLDLLHTGTATQHIRRVYLQTGDIDGNFRFSAPCNPDASFCDEDLITQVDAGGTVSLQVKCTPQSPGTHTAQVFVGTDTFQLLSAPVTLTCVGSAATAPVLGANPSQINFTAPVEVIGDTAKTTVHLSNPGGGTLVITDIRTVDVDAGTATDWTYTASGACTGQITSMCVLDPGEAIDLDVTFDPSAIGRRRATLLISYRDTLDRTKEIPLDGIGLGATLRAVGGVTSLSFGSVPIGRSAQLDVDLVNTGNRDTTAMLSVSNGGTPPFSVSPSPSAIVTPTAHKTITITCAPTTTGTFNATVTAQASDAFLSPATAFMVTCEGTSSDLYADPSSLELGEIRRDEGAITKTVQLLSNSGSPIALMQPQIDSVAPEITIGPLSSTTTPATFDVTLTPPSTEGLVTRSITVATSNETLRIPLAGKVVRASYDVATSVDLGTFCVGQPTTSSSVSLLSDGTATIEMMEPTLGKAPSPFQLSPTSPSMYPSSLGAGGAATVALTPQRQTSVATVSDTLTWRTNVAASPNPTTTVTARFIDRGGAIAPPSVDFGKVTIHLFDDDGQRVVLQNCNDTPLTLDPPMIRTPFSIDSPNFPAVLDPNETVAFSVGFHPTRKGPVSDTLRISSPQLPDGPLEVLLFGEGQTPDVTPPDAGSGSNGVSDTSFYACSCSSTSNPLGGIPIAAALVLVFFPRRRRTGYAGRR